MKARDIRVGDECRLDDGTLAWTVIQVRGEMFPGENVVTIVREYPQDPRASGRDIARTYHEGHEDLPGVVRP